jgi:hypothetical protein
VRSARIKSKKWDSDFLWVYTAQRGEKNKRRLAENNEIKKMLSKQPCEWEEIVWVKQKVQ